VDDRIVRALNHWFAQGALRADLARVLSIAPLIAIGALAALAWFADWGRAPERRAVLLIGAVGAVLALAVNLGLGHLYFRPRPFLALPTIHPLLPKNADSSMYSDHLSIAGALTASLVLTRRRLGAVASVLALLLAIGASVRACSFRAIASSAHWSARSASVSCCPFDDRSPTSSTPWPRARAG